MHLIVGSAPGAILFGTRGNFTQGERVYLLVLYFPDNAGSFQRALIRLTWAADSSNLARLALGFPEEVAAHIAWSQGDLAQRFDKEVNA